MDPMKEMSDEIKQSSKLMSGVDVMIKPKKLDHEIEEFKVLIVRSIINYDKDFGSVCHIKSKINLKTDFLINFIRSNMPEYDVGEFFKGGKIKLEYPIYVVTKDPIAASCMLDNFKNVDKELDEFITKREK